MFPIPVFLALGMFMVLFYIADFLGGPILFLALAHVLFSRGVEYQYFVDSSLEVVNGAPSEVSATPSTLEVGKEVGDVLGIIPGMLFLVIWWCTQGVAQISLGCVGLVDVGWAGRGDSIDKRSISFLIFWKVHQVPLYIGPDGIVSDFYFMYCLY